MLRYHIILVCNIDGKTMLMCKRRKPPYEGLFNFIGGKTEEGEESIEAAYRELKEEAGISKEEVSLVHVMDLTYYMKDCCVEVYAGRLNKRVEVWGEENELLWMGLEEDFFHEEVFAGLGNIGHIVAHVKKETNIFR